MADVYRNPLLDQVVISQYANSPIIRALIENMGAYFDPFTNFDDFYNYIWNVNTAQGYGLDIWGRIVGVGRVLHVQNSSYFGFQEGSPGTLPWNQGPFYSGGGITSNFSLSDTAYRKLILLKAFVNICDASIPTINSILRSLFPGRGNAFVIDNLDMTMTYRIAFTITPVESAILAQSGILPKPAGVAASISIDAISYFIVGVSLLDGPDVLL